MLIGLFMLFYIWFTPDVIVDVVYNVPPWQVAWGYPAPDPTQRNVYIKHDTWPGWLRVSPAPSQTTDAIAVTPHTDGKLYVVWTAQDTVDSPGRPYYASVAPALNSFPESGWVVLWNADLRDPWLYHDAADALLVAVKKVGTNTRYRFYWNGTTWEPDNAFQERRVYLPLLSRSGN